MVIIIAKSTTSRILGVPIPFQRLIKISCKIKEFNHFDVLLISKSL